MASNSNQEEQREHINESSGGGDHRTPDPGPMRKK